MKRALKWENSQAVGVIIAGGRAMRLGGGDKCMREIGGETILTRLLERFKPQVSALTLNANGPAARFEEYSLSITPDAPLEGDVGAHGPMAGVLTGLEWAAAQQAQWVLFSPADTPFLPRNLAAQLHHAAQEAGADLACARSNGRVHPLCSLWRSSLSAAIRDDLERLGGVKARRWMEERGCAYADYTAEPVDPFFNVNTTQDLAAAQQLWDRRRAQIEAL